jgi:YVTN family beta-propeller protein
MAGACLSMVPKAAPAPLAQPPPDFAAYRARVEPIFLKKRENGIRCYDCHSALATRLKLVPLSPGNQSWTEEQSRLNFQAVSQLIVPGDPAKSPLLLHPLAAEAGGDPTHTGGKFWASQSDPEWQTLAAWVRSIGKTQATPEAKSHPTSHDSLDFQFFKTKVEPVFLKDRPGHARCYGCHSLPGRVFRLEALPAGECTWTEEQSRSNFENAARQVVPGDLYSSPLLLHPLAPEAGGDAFHSGGRQFASQNDSDWLAMADWVRSARSGSPLDDKSLHGVLIYATNSAGNTIDVIDAETNKVVQVIRGIELPHGINFSPDGARVYISNESESVLDIVDRKTGEILRKAALSGRPNNIAVTRDGGRVLVGIRSEPGVVDVIDTTSLQRVKSIAVDGGVHNIYVTPDGKYAVSGSIENKAATVIDLQTEQALGEVKFDRGVRPMAFEHNSDGSTTRMFVQLSGFHGFAVVDFAKRVEIARISLPNQPSGFGTAEGRLTTPSHGIGVAPDGKSLWVNSTFANAVFKYSLPDLNLVGYIALPEVHPLGRSPTGSVPEWITFTPDSAVVYVSNSGAASVSAIDTRTMKRIAEISVGEVPKRINTLTLR